MRVAMLGFHLAMRQTRRARLPLQLDLQIIVVNKMEINSFRAENQLLIGLSMWYTQQNTENQKQLSWAQSTIDRFAVC